MMAINFRLKELIAKKERLEGERITYRAIQAETGVSTNTLSTMNRQKMKKVGIGTIDRLCTYFDCEPGDLIVRD